jgi:FkbM family methyltransferase
MVDASDMIRPMRTLPTGLRVQGATRADARYQQGIGEYFWPDLDIHPGMTAVDVGANIGLFSLEILRRCHGDAHVVAIEPAPVTFDHLERNLRGLYPRADTRLYRCAVSDHQGDTVLYYRPSAATISSLYRELPRPTDDELEVFVDGLLREPPPEYRETYAKWLRRLPRAPVKKVLKALIRRYDPSVVEIPCQARTLSAILRECHLDAVDLLKIDVEGAEDDVLRGIDVDDWPKIKALAVEAHDIDGRVEKTCELVKSRGFTKVQASQHWPFEGSKVYMVHAARVPTPAQMPTPTVGDRRESTASSQEAVANSPSSPPAEQQRAPSTAR